VSQTDRMLGPRGGGVTGAPSRAGLPRTLSQEALREVAASLTLMTNVTENPSRRATCNLNTDPEPMLSPAPAGASSALLPHAAKPCRRSFAGHHILWPVSPSEVERGPKDPLVIQ
jgi:hypothetical protein